MFPTIKAIQSFAAVLGFEKHKRKPLDRKRVDNIEWNTFNSDQLTHYIYLIALAETGDINILKYDIENPEETNSSNMLEIFEEYANGGFEIITEWLNKLPTDVSGVKALLAGMENSDFLVQNNDDIKEVEL